MTRQSFDQLIRRRVGTAVVEFGAPWCRHRRALDPLIDRLAAERPGILIAKIDTEDYPELAAEFGVRSIRTVIRFDRGELTLASLGGAPYEVLLEHLGLEPLGARAAA